jgi:hypothetical protein
MNDDDIIIAVPVKKWLGHGVRRPSHEADLLQHIQYT